ncbi:unnamed protein product [Prunus armeniaca]|uniref:Uncharacterized protein n=1 Tax=Prunus armeniaca TaxID=36596 RepID=A0A6J5UUP4_PRUAR|nr:unnamed protein product [Prunus armeniaca]
MSCLPIGKGFADGFGGWMRALLLVLSPTCLMVLMGWKMSSSSVVILPNQLGAHGGAVVDLPINKGVANGFGGWMGAVRMICRQLADRQGRCH